MAFERGILPLSQSRRIIWDTLYDIFREAPVIRSNLESMEEKGLTIFNPKIKTAQK